MFGSAEEALAGIMNSERPATPERPFFPSLDAEDAFNPGIAIASLVHKTQSAYARVTRKIDSAGRALTLADQAYRALDESLDRYPINIRQCTTYIEAFNAIYNQTEENFAETRKIAEALQLTARVVKTIAEAFKRIPAIPIDFTAITDLVTLIRRMESLYRVSRTYWEEMWEKLRGTPDVIWSMQNILSDFARRLDDMP